MSDIYIQAPISSVNSEVNHKACIENIYSAGLTMPIYTHLEVLFTKPSWTALPI